MNTTKNQFSIGIDGNYLATEPARSLFNSTSGFRQSEGASLIRGR